MKFGVVNKSTTVNRFVLHTLQHNITHLAVITRKSNIKLGILKGGKLEKCLILLLQGYIVLALFLITFVFFAALVIYAMKPCKCQYRLVSAPFHSLI